MSDVARKKPPSDDIPPFVWVQVHEDGNGITDCMHVPGGWLYRNIIYGRGTTGPSSFQFFVPASEVAQDAWF